MPVIIAVIITLVIAVPVTAFAATAYHNKVSAAKVGSAEEQARSIIDEAVKTAETKKREVMLEAKEESRLKTASSRKKRILIRSWKPLRREKPD